MSNTDPSGVLVILFNLEIPEDTEIPLIGPVGQKLTTTVARLSRNDFYLTARRTLRLLRDKGLVSYKFLDRYPSLSVPGSSEVTLTGIDKALAEADAADPDGIYVYEDDQVVGRYPGISFKGVDVSYDGSPAGAVEIDFTTFTPDPGGGGGEDFEGVDFELIPRFPVIFPAMPDMAGELGPVQHAGKFKKIRFTGFRGAPEFPYDDVNGELSIEASNSVGLGYEGAPAVIAKVLNLTTDFHVEQELDEGIPNGAYTFNVSNNRLDDVLRFEDGNGFSITKVPTLVPTKSWVDYYTIDPSAVKVETTTDNFITAHSIKFDGSTPTVTDDVATVNAGATTLSIQHAGGALSSVMNRDSLRLINAYSSGIDAGNEQIIDVGAATRLRVHDQWVALATDTRTPTNGDTLVYNGGNLELGTPGVAGYTWPTVMVHPEEVALYRMNTVDRTGVVPPTSLYGLRHRLPACSHLPAT